MTEQEKIAITKYDLYYEQRMTKVEAAIENLKGDVTEIKTDLREIIADIKWMLGVIGAVGFIIVGIMFHGFKWI